MRKTSRGPGLHPGAMESFRTFGAWFVPEIDAFLDHYFIQKKKTGDIPYADLMWGDLAEYCSRDGKRVRPLLLIAGYASYRRGKKNYREIVKIGAALELMHAFLLVQDDIIDKAPLRRGGPALHKLAGKYNRHSGSPTLGTDLAMIQADLLFTSALEIIGEASIPPKLLGPFLVNFSRTYERTAWGQLYDILYSAPVDLEFSRGVPLGISTLKTAYYTIYYPFYMGYLLAGGNDPATGDRIRSFAIPLGLAFQLRDDLLGVFGRREQTGKPDDSDLREGKITMLVGNARDLLSGGERDEFTRRFTARRKSAADIAWLRDCIRSCGALEATLKQHRAYVNRARKHLAGIGADTAMLPVLSGLVDLVRDVPVRDE